MSKSISTPKSNSLRPGYLFGGPIESIVPASIFYPSHPTRLDPDEYWMQEALRESLKGIGVSNPNPSVGCVLVDKDGNELARGSTQAYPGLHAERIAFQQIQDTRVLKDATAYVTLEPCSHYGKQPPCVDLLRNSQIKRVVIARRDPNPLVGGKGIQLLKEAGKDVILGSLAAEASAWNFSFFAHQFLKRPVCVLKWAQTLDGQLADDSDSSQWVSGPSSRAYAHWLRQRYDTILVGAGTFLADYPQLNVRDCSPPHQTHPLPIVLDPRGLCLNANKKVQKELSSRTFIHQRNWIYVTTQTQLRKHPRSWLKANPQVTILTQSGRKIIPELISLLKGEEVSGLLGHPLQSVMVEGGPKVLTTFLKSGFADLLHVFIAPKLTGGESHRIRTNFLLKKAFEFDLISSAQLGQDAVLEMTSKKLTSKVFDQDVQINRT